MAESVVDQTMKSVEGTLATAAIVIGVMIGAVEEPTGGTTIAVAIAIGTRVVSTVGGDGVGTIMEMLDEGNQSEEKRIAIEDDKLRL